MLSYRYTGNLSASRKKQVLVQSSGFDRGLLFQLPSYRLLRLRKEEYTKIVGPDLVLRQLIRIRASSNFMFFLRISTNVSRNRGVVSTQ